MIELLTSGYITLKIDLELKYSRRLKFIYSTRNFCRFNLFQEFSRKPRFNKSPNPDVCNKSQVFEFGSFKLNFNPNLHQKLLFSGVQVLHLLVHLGPVQLRPGHAGQLRDLRDSGHHHSCHHEPQTVICDKCRVNKRSLFFCLSIAVHDVCICIKCQYLGMSLCQDQICFQQCNR